MEARASLPTSVRSGKDQDQSSAQRQPPALLCPHESGIAPWGRAVSATLTRQIVPGDGWCWQPGSVGLLGVGQAGCDNVEKVLAPGRTHCLALMSGDLWSLAVEAREAGGPEGFLGGDAEGVVALIVEQTWAGGEGDWGPLARATPRCRALFL